MTAPILTSKQRVEKYVNLENMTCNERALQHYEKNYYTQNLSLTERMQQCFLDAGRTMTNIFQGEVAVLTPCCPFSIRQAFIAQYNGRVEGLNQDVGSGDGIAMTNFLGVATIGGAFTILARLIRVAVTTGFLFFSLMIAAYQQATYGKKMGSSYSIVQETIKRYFYEWADLGMSIGIIGVGLINTFGYNNISLNRLRDYYFERIDGINARDKVLADAIDKYNALKAKQQSSKGRTIANLNP